MSEKHLNTITLRISSGSGSKGFVATSMVKLMQEMRLEGKERRTHISLGEITQNNF